MENDHSTIGDLAAAIAHEIKNPVALAMANVGLIRLTSDSAQTATYCDHIEKALDSVNALVTAFIQSVSGGAPMICSFDVMEMLDGIIAEYRAAWPEIALMFLRPAEPLLYEGEPQKIRMVFTNLLKNAVEAAGPRGCIEVSAEVSGSAIRVAIRDSGEGVEETIPARADTGRYYAVTASKPNGSGIGLIICQSIVTRCGGRFEIGNHAQGGGQAVVTLPLCS